jgi:hypothetical protein
MKRWRLEAAVLLLVPALVALCGAAAAFLWRLAAPLPPLGLLLAAGALLLFCAGLFAAWLMADWRLKRANAQGEVLLRWQYGTADWEATLAMLRRVAGRAGPLQAALAAWRYRGAPAAGAPSVAVLEYAIVFGGADWWRWDHFWRLDGAAVMRGPSGTATFLLRLRPRIVVARWSPQEIFRPRQLTLAIPVPRGQEERAARVAAYLDRQKG